MGFVRYMSPMACSSVIQGRWLFAQEMRTAPARAIALHKRYDWGPDNQGLLSCQWHAQADGALQKAQQPYTVVKPMYPLMWQEGFATMFGLDRGNKEAAMCISRLTLAGKQCKRQPQGFQYWAQLEEGARDRRNALA